jgi:3-keto-5-aminohexanoate cleavage enzyme
MMEKVVITAAMIGAITSREKSPYPPMTPREIAESAIESWRAGAAVVCIHVRDLETQASSMKFDLYQEVFERIRGGSDVIINLTTGAGARLIYEPLNEGTPGIPRS